MSDRREIMRATFVDSRPNEAYGGVIFPRATILKMVEQYKRNRVPFTYNHDQRHPLDAVIINAGTTELEDGELSGWIDIDFLKSDLDWYQATIKAKNAPGGISVMVTQKIVRIGMGPTLLSISGDAAHWSDEDLLESFSYEPMYGAIEINRLFQFALSPNALIVITMLASIPVNILSSALYDLLKSSKRGHFFAKIVVKQTKRKRTIVFDASKEESIDALIALLPSIIQGNQPEVILSEQELLDNDPSTKSTEEEDPQE